MAEKTLRDLASDVAAELLGDAFELVEEPPQVLALDVLQHQVSVGMPALEHLVAAERADHALVLDRRPDLGFAQEAHEEALGLQQVRMDDLEGDASALLEAGCPSGHRRGVDLPHPARAQLAVDRVRPQPRTTLQGQGVYPHDGGIPSGVGVPSVTHGRRTGRRFRTRRGCCARLESRSRHAFANDAVGAGLRSALGPIGVIGSADARAWTVASASVRADADRPPAQPSRLEGTAGSAPDAGRSVGPSPTNVAG